MIEQEWLTASDPQEMSFFVCNNNGNNQRESGRRKLRLYACAQCRFWWKQLIDPRSPHAVEVAEGLADGLVQKDEVAKALAQSVAAGKEIIRRGAVSDEMVAAQEAVDRLGQSMENFVDPGWFPLDLRLPTEIVISEETYQAEVLRCIFGNPFQPFAFNRSWWTTNIRDLAQNIYTDRHMPSGAFDNQRMGVLADALEEAGCANETVLDHCRNGGNHFRGCWVVDQLLGKE